MPRFFPSLIILVGIICLTASCFVHDAEAGPRAPGWSPQALADTSAEAAPTTTPSKTASSTTEDPDPFIARAWRDNPTWSMSHTRLIAVCLNPDAFRLSTEELIVCGEALVELGNYYKRIAVQPPAASEPEPTPSATPEIHDPLYPFPEVDRGN